MAFKLKVPSPLARTEWYGLATSTAFVIDSLLQADLSTSVNGAVQTTASSAQILGAIQQAVASTDPSTSPYTTYQKVPVLVDEVGLWEADVYTTGTAATTYMEQTKCDLYSTTGIYVNVGASSVKQFAIVNFVSSSKVQGKITTWFGTNVN